MEGDKKEIEVLDDTKTYAGIPQAEFMDNIDEFMKKPENEESADKVLKMLDEQHCKYKFMEYNLMSKRRRLQSQIPDLKRSLSMIEKLRNEATEFETEFLLSDQVFAKAVVPPTKNVCLWLGANVMLEYSLDEAEKLLSSNITSATRNCEQILHDLDFLRDQFTTIEVNMARVFNWDVKRRQASKVKK